MSEAEKKTQLVNLTQQLYERLFLIIRAAPAIELLEMNITMPQYKILMGLSAHGPMRMKDIAMVAGTNPKSTTGIVDRLCERGIIIRSNEVKDRRSTMCKLTPEGEKLLYNLSELGEDSRKTSITILQQMSLSELEQLAAAIELAYIHFKPILKACYSQYYGNPLKQV